jgi:hypothetical protein
MTETDVERQIREHEKDLAVIKSEFQNYAERTTKALERLDARFNNGNGFSTICDAHTAAIQNTQERIGKVEAAALIHGRWLMGILSVVVAGVLLQIAKILFHF